jgi:uncharacterized protein (TIGR02145 family)
MMKIYKILLSFFLILISGMGFSQSVPSYVPTNGLVGWWGFNGNAQDGSGNGNHGTVNGATLTTDRFGYQNGAYSFDGNNSRIEVNDANSLDIPNGHSLSISTWIKHDLTSINIDKYIISKYGGLLNISPQYAIGTGISGQAYSTTQIDSGTQNWVELRGNSTINDGNWHHFVYVWYNGADASIYVDNAVDITRSHSLTGSIINALNLQFGCGANLSQFYNGKIDDIGIWNRALTPQEITNLYNSQLPTQTSLCLPTITTTSPSSVGVDTVVIGGDISNDGGSSIVLRGVCYSTSPNPNMGNQRTEDGSGTGSFNTVLRGLTSSTTYYARSYAKNSNGVVVYGNEVSFTTIASLPGVRCPGTPTVTDIDGNIYNTVHIGTQCWTQSNLKVSKYRNGDTIPTGLSNSQWGSTTSGAYAIYNNDPVNDGLYGKLYNHYAVTDSRGLCPTGWHVPSDGEWNSMAIFLDSTADTTYSTCGFCTQSNLAGGALKDNMVNSPGSWATPNGGATNISGFTGLPGGYRGSSGVYSDIGGRGWWYTSSNYSSSLAYGRSLYYFDATLSRGHGYLSYGVSVRCLKNTLPQVNTTSVTNVTTSTAIVTGAVISEGDQNTVRGFCYSTISNPTISNDTTMNGTGLGVYTGTLMNLTPLTTYYVRAYAANSVGTSYGSELIFTTDSIRIGSNYAGGIVFYVDSTGQHGLVCAPSDQGGFQWGCVGADIMGTSEAIGTGQSNTNLILSGCSDRPIAASVCDDLVLNGHNDWYLSSNQELILMYQNLRTHNVGNFSNEWYRSSSQFNSVDDWGVHFNFGYVTNLGKANGSYLVRAVRAF